MRRIVINNTQPRVWDSPNVPFMARVRSALTPVSWALICEERFPNADNTNSTPPDDAINTASSPVMGHGARIVTTRYTRKSPNPLRTVPSQDSKCTQTARLNPRMGGMVSQRRQHQFHTAQ